MDYLAGYSEHALDQVRRLMDAGQLGEMLLEKYPRCHQIQTEKALHGYARELKNRYLRTAPALSKAIYDPKIQVIEHALGYHNKIPRVQGSHDSSARCGNLRAPRRRGSSGARTLLR